MTFFDSFINALPFGAYTVIVIGLSSWLGKVWAERIREKERAKNTVALEAFKHELDILKAQNLRGFNDKIEVYRLVVNIISEAIGDVVKHLFQKQPVPSEIVFAFDKARMKVYGYLAMQAPQAVIDKYDALTDLIFSMIENPTKYCWADIRERCLAMINECRKDVGFDESPITYNGTR
jgi:hypothetical protein